MFAGLLLPHDPGLDPNWISQPMIEYLRWVRWQFYLLYCWPTRFGKEVDGDNTGDARMAGLKRLLYMLKLLPWMLLLSALGNLLIGFMMQRYAGSYRWGVAWSGVAVGVPIGVAVGVIFGVAFGVTFGVALAVALAVAFGVAFGVALGVALGVAVGVVFGIAVGGALGVALGVAGGVGYGAGFGFGVGVAVGVAFGAVVGVAGGVAGGVSSALALVFMYYRVGNIPLDFCLAWLAQKAARSNAAAAYRWWRRCPVFWNEVIYLPLPNAGKLLALTAQCNREEGFKQIAFVAAERPLQRQVAVQALSEIALGDLEATSISRVATTSERLSWIGDTPLVLPEEFNQSLPVFERAAQQASQFLSVTSTYRKAGALRGGVDEVDRLEKMLGDLPGPAAPRLLRIAGRWRQVLQVEQAQLKQLAADRHETPNPFIFGTPLDEANASVFMGRRNVVDQIEASLLGVRQSPALLLYGPRRMGKSSILKQLPRLLGSDFACAWIDCQNPAVAGTGASTSSFLHLLSAALTEGLLRRRITVVPLSLEALAHEPFAAFDGWLTGVEKAMPAGMRALLCLDDYEWLQGAVGAGWGEDFLELLRQTLQPRHRFVLLFTGARKFAELGTAWADRFKGARRVRVRYLEPQNVHDLLTGPIPEFDLTYAPGAIEDIINATHCHPFLVQAVGFELVQYLNEKQLKEATSADVEVAISRVLESNGEYFAGIWSDAGPAGQVILRDSAQGVAGPQRAADWRNRGAVESVAWEWLREREFLEADSAITVPMLKRWVLANALPRA